MDIAELLQEYTTSRMQFSQILNDATIRMGFECEMVATEFGDDDEDYDYDGDDEDSDDEDDDDEEEEEEEEEDEPNFDAMTFEQMENTFGVTIDHGTRRLINRLYSEWKDSRLRREWDIVRHSYVPAYLARHPGHDTSDAYHSWRASRTERLPQPDSDEARDDDMDAFIREKYRSMSEFMDEFGIEWSSSERRPQIERSHLHESEEQVHAEIARSLRSALDVKAVGGDARDPYTTWQVIADGSIESDRGPGAEVVSAVYSLKEGLEKLQQCFHWMDDNGMETNSTTGLHVSFSIDGKTSADDYDIMKMMIFFDENYTASLFGRLDEYYAKQMRNVLFHDMQNNDPATLMQSRNIDTVIGALRRMGNSLPSGVGNEKYHSFRHRDKGVFEFRNMGGSDYQDKFDVVRKRIINMAYIMKIGSDTTLMRREYLTRVWNMLTGTKFQDPSLRKKPPRQQVPLILNTFADIIERTPSLSWLSNDTRRLLVALVKHIDIADTSRQQQHQLRFALKRYKMGDAGPWRRHLPDEQYNSLAELMNWPLMIPGEHPDEQEPLPFAQRGSGQSNVPAQEVEPPDPYGWRQHALPYTRLTPRPSH